jgi:uncharacterized membrane protein YidH (DUF202 family)
MSGRDPGLQPERTLLAWRRTSLGLLVNGGLLLASGLDNSPVRFGLGLVVTVIALCCWAVVGAVYRRIATGGSAPAPLGSDRVIRSAAGLVLVVGLFDLYAVVTH